MSLTQLILLGEYKPPKGRLSHRNFSMKDRGEIEKLSDYAKKLPNAERKEYSKQRVIDCITKNGPSSAKEIADYLGCWENTARDRLTELMADQKVTMEVVNIQGKKLYSLVSMN